MGQQLAPPRRRLTSILTNPWARPRFLWVFAVAYVVWTMVPVVTAIWFSFNSQRSISQFQSFSLRWYVGDPNDSLLHDPSIRAAVVHSLALSVIAVVVTVPLGVAFAVALDRWRGRGSGAANFTMLFSFITPELILAVALFLVFVNPFAAVGLGVTAQSAGLVVLTLAYPVVIVRARLLSLGPEYEQAAMDLGASPTAALRRVTLPLLYPAIFASAAVVFAFALDDFVIVSQLARDASDQTVSMFIFSVARTAPTPSANAVGTVMLTSATIVVVLAALWYRRATRDEPATPGAGPLPAP